MVTTPTCVALVPAIARHGSEAARCPFLSDKYKQPCAGSGEQERHS